MYRYDYQTWFTLKEVFAELGTTYTPYDGVTLGSCLHDTGLLANAPIWDSYANEELKDYIEDLWQILYARFYNWYCAYLDYDYTTDEEATITEDVAVEFLYRFINVLVMSYDKYSVLLGYYDAQKSNLLDKIETTFGGTNRFNDTPQNEEGSTDFSNDDHVSNITITDNTSSTDGESPMMRLKEIQDHYKEVMDDWCNLFKKLFIPEEDITI